MVSLAFLPSAERLTVVVIKARNLRVVDDTRVSSGMLYMSLTTIQYIDMCSLLNCYDIAWMSKIKLSINWSFRIQVIV